MIKLIAAISKNGVIGKDGDLIYRDSEDMRLFKRLTTNHNVFMGRKTWDSLKQEPLPNRKNFVFTRGRINPEEFTNPFMDVDTYIDTIDHLDKSSDNYKNRIDFIIGGGQIYKQLIHLADEIYLSQFRDIREGDTYFPEINSSQWECKYIKVYTNFDLKVFKRKYGSI